MVILIRCYVGDKEGFFKDKDVEYTKFEKDILGVIDSAEDYDAEVIAIREKIIDFATRRTLDEIRKENNIGNLSEE